MQKPRLSKTIVKMMIKDRIQYPGRFIIDTFAVMVRYGVLMALYWYVFQFNKGEIQGINFQIAAWSMFLYFSFMTLGLRRVARAIMKDVKTGSVENLFAKPINYLSYRSWWQIGEGGYPFLVTLLLGIFTLALVVGVPKSMLSLHFLLSAGIVFILSILLSLLIYIIVGLFAFWMEEVEPIYWIVDKAVMILGGSYLPVALFPDLMYQIALYSPFGASQFLTHTVYDTWSDLYLRLISIQLLWVLVLGVLSWFMFKRASQNVSVNGG